MAQNIYKKLFLSKLLIGLGLSASWSAPGDTTVVNAHIEQRLSWYENYDMPASFPDGTTEYRKIIMEFELGKYMCDGYNPSNPGEISDGGTGWCGDWDYDVHVLLMNSAGDTLELGELITPYANSNFPATPLSWKHKYNFDVTDYYQYLKDDVTIRIFYAGWSGGFTGTVKFHMIEGTRPRDVVGIHKLYHGNFAYGLASNPIAESVAPANIEVPSGTQYAAFRTIISGHGGISGSNCAEFCKKWMKYIVNESELATWDIWRDDCGDNWLHVQSGTWIYDRANWCPGNQVEPFIQPIPLSALSSSTLTADIEFQPFSTTVEGASYKMSTHIIFYGEYKNDVDAGIEEIRAPNNMAEFGKLNPVCGDPSIKIKNYGKEPISSIKIEYGVEGGTTYTQTFSTTIQQEEAQILDLNNIDEIKNASGENVFKVKIIEVNGETDGDAYNNEHSSTFVNATQYTNSAFYIVFKNSGNISGALNNTSWEITNVETGDVVISRAASAANATYTDTFWLPNGCYKLDMKSPKGYGLSFFSSISRGYLKMFNYSSGSEIIIPKSRLGSTSLDGNFGNGFAHYFTINDPLSNDDDGSKLFFNVYPNPTSDLINISLNNIQNETVQFKLVNTLGQIVKEDSFTGNTHSVNVNALSNGVYQLVLSIGNYSKTQSVIISK